MHSLGFKSAGSSQDKSGPAQISSKASSAVGSVQPGTNQQSSTSTSSDKLVLSESDKLNGNNQPENAPGIPGGGKQAPGGGAGSEDGAQPVRRRAKPVCAAAKQPAARASMGAIIKGSVMDKVTHVFNHASGVSSSMGNANNSKTASSEKPVKPAPVPPNLAPSGKNNKDTVEQPVSVISANDVKQQLAAAAAAAGSTSPTGTNIPKGNFSLYIIANFNFELENCVRPFPSFLFLVYGSLNCSKLYGDKLCRINR